MDSIYLQSVLSDMYMKLITHYIFTAGLLVWMLPGYLGFLLSVWLAFSVNRLIDFGHTHKHGFSSRSWVTHDLFTAPLWGLAVGFLTYYALQYANVEISLVILAGLVSALSHLFLDSVTESGIFVSGKRKALAHFSYNNPFINAVFIVAGLLFILIAFTYPVQTLFLV